MLIKLLKIAGWVILGYVAGAASIVALVLWMGANPEIAAALISGGKP